MITVHKIICPFPHLDQYTKIRNSLHIFPEKDNALEKRPSISISANLTNLSLTVLNSLLSFVHAVVSKSLRVFACLIHVSNQKFASHILVHQSGSEIYILCRYESKELTRAEKFSNLIL